MRKLVQIFEFQLKQFTIFTVLMGGLGAHAFAQAPSLSLPSLPPLAAPVTSNNPTIGALPPINLPALAQPANPVIVQPASPASPSASAAVPASPPSVLPTLPPLPGSPEAVKAENDAAPKGSLTPIVPKAVERRAPDTASAVAVDAPVGGMPPLPAISTPPAVATLPDIEVDSTVAAAPPLALPVGIPVLPLPGEESAPAAEMSEADALAALEEAPVVNVVREKAPPKTWETKLAPAIIPLETNFNYKRALLPSAIYRTDYDKNNNHLPRRITRDDYASLLFTSVAKNDLTTTRALLNAGVSLKATNPYGETPLELARRLGAEQVAQLLMARGAM